MRKTSTYPPLTKEQMFGRQETHSYLLSLFSEESHFHL